MKSLKLLQILFLLALSSCESCEEKVWTELPLETQKGANTFGCYVNDNLWVAQRGYGYFGASNPSAIYSRSNNSLELYGAGKNGIIYIYIYESTEQPDNLLFKMNYKKNSIFYEINKDEQNRGKVYLTKLDTIDKIASGIFSNIQLINIEEKDSIFITQGRFDIKLDMYNN